MFLFLAACHSIFFGKGSQLMKIILFPNPADTPRINLTHNNVYKLHAKMNTSGLTDWDMSDKDFWIISPFFHVRHRER